MNLEEFQIHNTHLDGAFSDLDPHLRRLRALPLIYRFPLLDRLPRTQPGIYTVGGGRQIGKTTLLKQWMADLLATGLDPARLRFFTGELIDDHHSLSTRCKAGCTRRVILSPHRCAPCSPTPSALAL